MQSPEYPDLWWGGPVSFTAGRSRPVQYVVIHSTEGGEGPLSAEAGSAYDRRRTDGTSTHYFHDQDSTVQEVLTTDRAHHARQHGNAIGLGHELCGLAGQTDPQWHDVASLGTMRNAAKQVARDCVKYGLPVRRLSVAEVRAAYYAPEGQRPKGICGHGDVTAAYPEDGGSHWDPGPNFPWVEFLDMVAAEMTEEDFMAGLTEIQQQDMYRRIRNIDSWMYYGFAQGRAEIPAGAIALGYGEGTPTTAPTPFKAAEALAEILALVSVPPTPVAGSFNFTGTATAS